MYLAVVPLIMAITARQKMQLSVRKVSAAADESMAEAGTSCLTLAMIPTGHYHFNPFGRENSVSVTRMRLRFVMKKVKTRFVPLCYDVVILQSATNEAAAKNLVINRSTLTMIDK